jgi:ATP-dependent Lhr-like helicase
MLDGYEVAANAWEQHVLPARVERYEPSMLDMLCLTGEVGWARLSAATGAQPVGATPIALFVRSTPREVLAPTIETTLTPEAQGVLAVLRTRGASFPRELASHCTLGEDDLQRVIGELVSAGLIASDGFAGLRALVSAQRERKPRANFSGRWSLLENPNASRDEIVEAQARTLLRRYGVVFRRLLTRETNAAPWRELARVYRRLEARGEIRGGRFVYGMSGEQFALPEAVNRIRELRREGPDGKVIVISAADPLNLTGILTTGERVRAIANTRIAYRDGVAVSVMEGDMLRPLTELDSANAMMVATALAGRRVPVTSGFVGR